MCVVSENRIMDQKRPPCRTLIVLGSGGHTAEMIQIVKSLDKTKYSPRYYVLAKSDITSRKRVAQIESSDETSHAFLEIFRSREVKQSYLTSVFTTILALIASIPLVFRLKPELILCNGPGTCVPICLVAYFLSLFRIIPRCKIVFVESFCRVKTISLSGKILKYFVDLFVVQWPSLARTSGKIKYLGKLT